MSAIDYAPPSHRLTDHVDRVTQLMLNEPFEPPQTARSALASPLEIIAGQIRTMPYGDVVAMSEAFATDPRKIWDWANKTGCLP